MADLMPRIERLVGRLAGGRGGEAARHASGAPPELRLGDAGFAEAVARLVALPLDHYARDGPPLEIRVPWHGETLWFVPDDRQAEALVRNGVSPGRVWTAEELSHVMSVASRIGETVPTISIAKIAVDGEIVEVDGRRSRTGPAPRHEQGERKAK